MIVFLSILVLAPTASGKLSDIFDAFDSTGASVSHVKADLGSDIFDASGSTGASVSGDTAALDTSLTRIVGGSIANPTLYPWYTFIRLRKVYPDKSTRTVSCAGTLVAPDIVLTAAHCFNDKILDINVFVNNTSRNQLSGFEYLRAGKSWKIHPDYVVATFENDIAILLLDSPVKQVTPVPLNTDDRLPQDGTDLQVLGLGFTAETGGFPDNLQIANLQSLNMDICTSSYFTSPAGSIPVSADIQLCASAPGQDSCQGDSGGPLVLTDGSSFTQVGIVSFGLGCAREVSCFHQLLYGTGMNGSIAC